MLGIGPASVDSRLTVVVTASEVVGEMGRGLRFALAGAMVRSR